MERVRRDADVRLNFPKGRRGVELVIPDPDFVYGLPVKPPTPIKDVICNYYGDSAACETMMRYEQIAKIVCLFIICSHRRS